VASAATTTTTTTTILVLQVAVSEYSRTKFYMHLFSKTNYMSNS
jgi:hypothetical protein